MINQLFKSTPIILLCFFIDAKAQVYDISALTDLLKTHRVDSIAKIERTAALHFHKLINGYRLKNSLDTLAWDDVLWLACRNHNSWMISNKMLSHSENSGTPNFTGSSPGDRYLYASARKGTCQWSGENALYNQSCVGNTIAVIALKIAQASFTQWQNSKGHNKNMLGPRHKVHGVAFSIAGDVVHATDLFASNLSDSYLKSNDPQPFAVAVTESTTEISSPKEKRIKVDFTKLETTLYNKLYNDTGLRYIKKDRSMAKASLNHSKYMASVKKISHHECRSKKNYYGETEVKRLMKASNGLYYFKKNKMKIIESVVMIEIDAVKMNSDSLAREIIVSFNKENNLPENILKVGYGFSFRRSGNTIKCYAVRMCGYKGSVEKAKNVLLVKQFSNNSE